MHCWSSSGQKDRTVPLPEAVIPDIRSQLQCVWQWRFRDVLRTQRIHGTRRGQFGEDSPEGVPSRQDTEEYESGPAA